MSVPLWNATSQIFGREHDARAVKTAIVKNSVPQNQIMIFCGSYPYMGTWRDS
jgi:hypothetical protein